MIFLVPYAYDRMPGGKPRESVPANRLGGKARCDALIDVATRALKINHEDGPYGIWCDFVFSAGYTKDSPTKPTLVVIESIAEQMAKYVRSTGIEFASSVDRHDLVWGTYFETVRAIRRISSTTVIAHNRGYKNNGVYVGTNLGHLPRVWLCWLFLKPKGWKIHFVLANHSFAPKEWLQETAKFFQYLYRFVFKKW